MAWPDPHFLPCQAPPQAPVSTGSSAKVAGSLVSIVLGATEPMDPPKNWSHHLTGTQELRTARYHGPCGADVTPLPHTGQQGLGTQAACLWWQRHSVSPGFSL